MTDPHAERLVIDADPFAAGPPDAWGGHIWPGRWIAPPDTDFGDDRGIHWQARTRVELTEPTTFTVHVSGDQRYRLRIGDFLIGRGPERGVTLGTGNSAGVPGSRAGGAAWHFATHRVSLPAGTHTVVADCWSADPAIAPAAQGHCGPAFLLATADGPAELNTGDHWETRRLDDRRFVPPPPNFSHRFAGNLEAIRGAVVDAGPEAWTPAVVESVATGSSFPYSETVGRRVLVPARCPAMLEQPWTRGRVRSVADYPVMEPDQTPPPVAEGGEPADITAWSALWSAGRSGGGAVTLPPGRRVRVVLDLADYVCGYPAIRLSGDGRVSWSWCESLYEADPLAEGYDNYNVAKGDRDAIDGKWVLGKGDTFACAGTALSAETLWWRAGRYIVLIAEAGDAPLVVDAISVTETRYPLALTRADFQADHPAFAAPVQAMMRRGLECCLHETFMDCPFFEQLMYTGDTRLEALVTTVLAADDRPLRKALECFARSRTASGLTPCRAPCNDAMVIPGFSLVFVQMLRDLAAWRGHDRGVAAEIRELLPAVRSVVEAWLAFRNADGLVDSPPGWCFVDWVSSWPNGAPPGAQGGINACMNLHLACVLDQAAELEAAFGDATLATRDRIEAAAVFAASHGAFWSHERGLFVEHPDHPVISEHAQTLALLGGRLTPADAERAGAALFGDAVGGGVELDRATIYFSFYVLEVARQLGRADAFFDRLGFWAGLPAQGFKAPPEQPEPTRSDCHAWGAHPLYHYAASVAGLRPTGPLASGRFALRPMLGPLSREQGGSGLRARLPVLGHNLELTLDTDTTGVIRGPSEAARVLEVPEGVTWE